MVVKICSSWRAQRKISNSWTLGSSRLIIATPLRTVIEPVSAMLRQSLAQQYCSIDADKACEFIDAAEVGSSICCRETKIFERLGQLFRLCPGCLQIVQRRCLDGMAETMEEVDKLTLALSCVVAAISRSLPKLCLSCLSIISSCFSRSRSSPRFPFSAARSDNATIAS